ncbi:hypothetical protein M427DRAFT_132616 [Gonapodya prolifera JEL478]|uniref:Uncharacterized protein n=1 Tax=Gonapodya prolifera (strain JEL478) TaxID=1344416 RepID=A0A139APK7_GONPJ|nr:hypothetical protein M427DRAFT_132616 [Gonapodya prolifera JEL478]|eukprot:KXS18680.1 hypothetical protein M427DRAFT_132616 [Gonapodya prolifera JEL478]
MSAQIAPTQASFHPRVSARAHAPHPQPGSAITPSPATIAKRAQRKLKRQEIGALGAALRRRRQDEHAAVAVRGRAGAVRAGILREIAHAQAADAEEGVRWRPVMGGRVCGEGDGGSRRGVCGTNPGLKSAPSVDRAGEAVGLRHGGRVKVQVPAEVGPLSPRGGRRGHSGSPRPTTIASASVDAVRDMDRVIKRSASSLDSASALPGDTSTSNNVGGVADGDRDEHGGMEYHYAGSVEQEQEQEQERDVLGEAGESDAHQTEHDVFQDEVGSDGVEQHEHEHERHQVQYQDQDQAQDQQQRQGQGHENERRGKQLLDEWAEEGSEDDEVDVQWG